MDLDQQQKQIRRYSTISLALHASVFLVCLIGSFFTPKSELLQNAVQIDMVALPDQVKSQDSKPVDTSLPVKEDAPAPPKEEEAKKEDAPEPVELPKAEKKPVDDFALQKEKEREAKKRAEKALKKMREQAKKEAESEALRRQEALDKKKADLKRFEQAYRNAIRGNQKNQGSSNSGALEAAANAYGGHITNKLQSNWTLPPYLQDKGLRAVVRIYINAGGYVTRIMFIRVSGNSVFDNQVEKAIRESSPFSAPPEEMAPGLRSSGAEVLFPL